MNTRRLTLACLSVLLIAGAAGAAAAEFSMGGSGVMSAQDEPAALDDTSLAHSPGMGSGERSVGVGTIGSGRYVRGAESPGQADLAPARDDDHAESAATSTPSAGPRAVIPAATPGVPAKPRSANRWQSLVPGAIK